MKMQEYDHEKAIADEKIEKLQEEVFTLKNNNDDLKAEDKYNKKEISNLKKRLLYQDNRNTMLSFGYHGDDYFKIINLPDRNLARVITNAFTGKKFPDKKRVFSYRELLKYFSDNNVKISDAIIKKVSISYD